MWLVDVDWRLGLGEFDGQRVVVMGLGRFGGGAGAAAWLAAQGADVLATDMAEVEQLGSAMELLRPHVDSGAVTLRLGGHNVSDFTGCDLVVVNPGVPKPWENRFVRAARAAGIRVTTEIGLVVERLPDLMGGRRRVIGVTGTAGKSTTTAMIEAGLGGCGVDAVVGGNIGGSLLGRLSEIGAESWVVLELSSAMLWWLGGQDGEAEGWSPGIAVVTGFAANHEDWHGSAEHYEACKRLMLTNQQPGDFAVLGQSVAQWETRDGVERVLSDAGGLAGTISTPGAHNRANAAMAMSVCGRVVGPERWEHAATAIGLFGGLEHRCQLVYESESKIRFYNDSKCTVPGGVRLAALGVGEAVGGIGRVHLIAGGSSKGSDLSEIGLIGKDVGGLYAIGNTAEEIAAHAGGRAIECGTLPRALEEILEAVQPGEAVLLSPGCASFGEFANYEHRGREFARLVREMWA